MAGLLEMGRGHRREAMQGLRDVAQMEKARNQTNEQLKAAKRASEANSMGSGAVIGAELGGKYLAGKSLGLGGANIAGTAVAPGIGIGTAAPVVVEGAAAGASSGAKAGAMGGPMGMALGALAGLAVGYFLS